jgi:eIF-2B alpha/beta/delta-like uncharacterized protein
MFCLGDLMAISNLQKDVKKIAADNQSGATELTVKAIEIYLKYLEPLKVTRKNKFFEGLTEIGNLLRVAHPSMISISNIVELVANQAYANAQKMNLSELKHSIFDYLTRLESEIINAKKRIAEEALNLIPMGAVIITLSESATVEEIIKQAHLEHKISRVIILESRPLLEGLNMADRLLKIGLSVTVIVDAAMGFFCKEADLAIIGADTIQSDGSLVHKVGTYPLALTCSALKKPFYVASDTLKFSKTTTYEKPVEIKLKPSKEIINPKKLPGADVRNIYFDLTPSRYITCIITEKGAFMPTNLIAGVLSSS